MPGYSMLRYWRHAPDDEPIVEAGHSMERRKQSSRESSWNMAIVYHSELSAYDTPRSYVALLQWWGG